MNSPSAFDQPINNNHHLSTPLKHRRQSAQPMRHSVSSKEFHQLLGAAGNDPVARDLKQIATIVFYTGIRPGELKKLAWADIDLEKRRMRVGSKSGKRRLVLFGHKVLQILVERAKVNTGSQYVCGRYPAATISRISRRLRALPCTADGRKLTLCCLRHTFAERWMLAGGSLEGLRLVMGFSIPLPFKTFLSQDQQYAVAARFQSQLEDQSVI